LRNTTASENVLLAQNKRYRAPFDGCVGWSSRQRFYQADVGRFGYCVENHCTLGQEADASGVHSAENGNNTSRCTRRSQKAKLHNRPACKSNDAQLQKHLENT